MISPKMETISKIFRALEEGGVYFAWMAPGVYTMNVSLVKHNMTLPSKNVLLS